MHRQMDGWMDGIMMPIADQSYCVTVWSATNTKVTYYNRFFNAMCASVN